MLPSCARVLNVVAGAVTEKTPVIKGEVTVAYLVKRRPVPNPPLQRTR